MSAGADMLTAFWLGLANHLWLGTLVMALLWGLDRLLRRAPAAVRADLWTLALAKVALPAALGGAVVAAAAEHFAAEVPTVGAVVATVMAPAPTVAPASDWNWVVWPLTVAWLAGVAVALGRLARDLWAQSRLDANVHPVTEEPLRRAAERAHIPLDRILVAADAPLPMVVGWWQPRILIPSRLVPTLAPRELEALLRHEDRHRRRRDPLRLLLGRLVTAVFWFYPPWRWLLARLHECSEYACDEAALAAGISTDEYVRALARAIQRGLDPASPAAAAASGGPTLLRRRLARLGRKEKSTMTFGRLILTGAALIVGAAVFFPLDLVAEEEPPPPPPPPAEVVEPAPVAASAPVAEPAPPAEPAAIAEPDERLVPAAPVPPSGVDLPPPPPKATPAPPAPAATGDHLVIAPRLIQRIDPQYPKEALKSQAEGTVELTLLIGSDGKVRDVTPLTVVPDHPEFTKAAAKAAYQCTFTPGTLDDVPTRMKITMTFTFHLAE